MKKIMLDPGHYGYYNMSPVNSEYYESIVMLQLAYELKEALEDYGFIVGMTRYDLNEDLELTARGRKAKGYDLFLSLHSNAASSETPDAPWLIHYSDDIYTDLDEKSREIARVLGPIVSTVMGVSAPYYYTKSCDFDRDGDGRVGDEYYGVLFGAKSVGVPGVIIEHSFHTNKKATAWLLGYGNIKNLARAEARALAEYYGMENTMTAAEKKDFEALKKRVMELEETLKKSDDQDFEALKKRIKELESQVKPKYAYIDDNLPDWATPTMKKLVNKGIMKGNGNNSFEMSYLFMRIMVMLDRQGMFD